MSITAESDAAKSDQIVNPPTESDAVESGQATAKTHGTFAAALAKAQDCKRRAQTQLSTRVCLATTRGYIRLHD